MLLIIFLCLSRKVSQMNLPFFLVALQLAIIVNFTAFAQSDDLGPITDAVPTASSEPMPESGLPAEIKMKPVTHPEKIVFSQMKLGKTTPDFDEMARNSPIYLKAAEMDKAAVMLSEYNRLSNSFNVHNPEQDIVVHAKLRVDQYSSLQNLLVFDELDEKTFFRFQMYGMNIGIVPENIKQFQNIQISPSRANDMFNELRGNPEINAEFILRPTFADGKQPFNYNGNDFWLMFARIGEVRLWTSKSPNAHFIWYYKAPWYTPIMQAGLDDLFNE